MLSPCILHILNVFKNETELKHITNIALIDQFSRNLVFKRVHRRGLSLLLQPKLVVKGTQWCSEPWPGTRALCQQGNWVVCPRWSGVPRACFMLGSSGHNTENLTANHSGATCWEKCRVPHTLKNPSVVFYRSRNHWAPARDPTHLPHIFPVAIKICLPISSIENSSILSSLCPIFHFIIIPCLSPG